MQIDTVRREENEQNELTGYWLNETTYIPLSEDNYHYRTIVRWINAGGQVEPASPKTEPDNTAQEAALVRLKEAAKTNSNVADILTILRR
jgi:hypothetical protein